MDVAGEEYIIHFFKIAAMKRFISKETDRTHAEAKYKNKMFAKACQLKQIQTLI